MDTVWRLVMDREEAKECTLALELDLADELEMSVLGGQPSPPEGQVEVKVRPLKHSAMMKPMSKKKKKELEFQEVIRKTKKLSSWRLVNSDAGRTAKLTDCEIDKHGDHDANNDDFITRILEPGMLTKMGMEVSKEVREVKEPMLDRLHNLHTGKIIDLSKTNDFFQGKDSAASHGAGQVYQTGGGG